MDLERWLAIPRLRSNVVSLAMTAAVMALITIYDGGPDRVLFLREVAALMAGAHAVMHLSAIRGLRALAHRGVPLARQALAAYRDPRRVSHLDIAAAWVGFFVLVPYAAAADP